jgi:putative flippase GtrA
MRRIVGWLREQPRALRFLFVGALNTLFGYAVFALLVYLAVPYQVALLLALIIGVAFNFLTTGAVVFDGLLADAIPRFVVVYAAMYVFNLAILTVLVEVGLDKIVAQAVCLLIVAPVTYVALKRFVFRGPARK